MNNSKKYRRPQYAEDADGLRNKVVLIVMLIAIAVYFGVYLSGAWNCC